MDIYEKFEDCCIKEYEDAKFLISFDISHTTAENIVKCGLQRLIGAFYLAERLGAEFEDLDLIYTAYRLAFEELKDYAKRR